MSGTKFSAIIVGIGVVALFMPQILYAILFSISFLIGFAYGMVTTLIA